MRVAIVLCIVGNHRDIGFRFRIVVEGERKLRVDLPNSRIESSAERLDDATDPARVPAALRLADNELAVKELDTLSGPEDAELHQPVVLGARPSTCPRILEVRDSHGGSVAAARAASMSQI